MDKQLSDFIWQGTVVVLFLASITLLLLVSSEVDKMHRVTKNQSASVRVITVGDQVPSQVIVEGDQLYMAVASGVDVPYIIEGTRIEVGQETTPSALWIGSSYRRNKVIIDGVLTEVLFERLP